jgi:uncharacterized Zn-binding protein involved in type VI secretion
MARTVSINPPKTPCTTETRGVAKATIPNICKMPGPPAPFVPAPLPNIGKSNLSPKGYSKTVKIEGKTVAIRGATFGSMGDMASKGTGGGLISANTHGPTKFITPGSMNVKIDGKNVHQLGEPMLNNCGPSGNPPNTGATMMGFDTYDLEAREGLFNDLCQDLCAYEHAVQEGEIRRKSDDLEFECRASGKYDGRATFREAIPMDKDPNAMGFLRDSCEPDVFTTDHEQCYDFKLCGDEPREDQRERQAAITITEGTDPIIVSCETCSEAGADHPCPCECP